MSGCRELLRAGWGKTDVVATSTGVSDPDGCDGRLFLAAVLLYRVGTRTDRLLTTAACLEAKATLDSENDIVLEFVKRAEDAELAEVSEKELCLGVSDY